MYAYREGIYMRLTLRVSLRGLLSVECASALLTPLFGRARGTGPPADRAITYMRDPTMGAFQPHFHELHKQTKNMHTKR